MPTGKSGIAEALREGKAIGCTAVQVFTKSPRVWASPVIPADKIRAFREAAKETGLAIVSHDSYLINLAEPQEESRARSREALIAEMNRSGAYGIPFVVSHMGAHHGEGDEAVRDRVVEETRRVLAETDERVTLLMETTAGQGSAINSRFEGIAAILDAAKNPDRLAVCLDTCHVFVAGYDLRTPQAFAETFEDFDSLIGFEKLKVVHANDSKKGLGSHADRHENLGEGMIGVNSFKMLVNDERFQDKLIVIETPTENDGHAKDVAKLWSWAGGKPTAV